jgi:hypothetical protein
MMPPKIQAHHITQEGAPTQWKATGREEGIGWKPEAQPGRSDGGLIGSG